MNEVLVFGKLVRFQNAVMDVAVTNLRDTLAIIPAQHLTIIRQIDVVSPSSMGHGPTYAGGGSGLGYPRLSELCFDRSYRSNNFPINLTLLHEVGHILDHLYGCLANLSAEHRTALDAIRIPASARTHGPGERYAIAYQQFIAGGASDAVRAAVLSSRAFSNVSTIPP
jgi:hypothetical protein